MPVDLELSHVRDSLVCDLFTRFVTACTVVQAVVKADSQSNENAHMSTRRGSEIPERINLP